MREKVFPDLLKKTFKEGAISEKIYKTFQELYESYSHSVETDGLKMADYDYVFENLLSLVKEQLAHPHKFESYHQKITAPYNYYQFGLNFVFPLVDKKRSKVLHIDNVEKMSKQVAAGENVILFSNHQTEVDPQLIFLILEGKFSSFASEIIFVAGERVLLDPMAIPFSMGCNLLCIFSRRHIAIPPERKNEKQQHNHRTMQRMRALLSEGGKCIYVAPSGGRDRPNSEGKVVVSPFDPQSVEMFRLMAKQAKTPTHFYPLALATFDILPPPQAVEIELGEKRIAKRGGIFFSFGDEINLEDFPGADMTDRKAVRIARAMHICNLVKAEYKLLKQC
ncbi:MAG: 1-acyl-sn-glycerol-3-phosphate acyltransferase [Chlamydiales bacterium]